MMNAEDTNEMLLNYYKSQFIDSFRSKVEGDNTMIFLGQE